MNLDWHSSKLLLLFLSIYIYYEKLYSDLVAQNSGITFFVAKDAVLAFDFG